MRLGLSSWACAWSIGVPGQEPSHKLDAVGLIAFASDLGLDLVQMADNLPVADYAEVRRAAIRHGISIELGTRGIGAEHLRTQLDLCRLLDSRILRVVIDTREHEPSPDEVVESIKPMLPDLKAAGVTLGIENHDRFSTRTFADIVSRIGDASVGICLDTVNSFGSLEGPEVVVKTLAPMTVNLHVKDFVVLRASHLMGFEITGTPAGEGRLDIPWLLDAIQSTGRNPSAIIEHWPAPEATIEETAAKERLWCERSVENMRKLIPAGLGNASSTSPA
jgi:sugar phosphate isomerase/epimerase